MKQIVLTRDIFYDQVKSYIKNEESINLIEKSYRYAEQKHSGQFRKSGEPYFVHVFNVAYVLAQLHSSPVTISAGFLHDVVEDCGVTKEEFVEEFGEEIYNIVEAVTKIGNLEFKDEKEYLAANHRKIFIAMAKDVRVILVKLVDRLHNMRTLQYQPVEKQRKIAQETLEVYAPIAHRLGIAEIKNELEDLCFYYLNNEKYHEIARLVENKKSERDAYVKTMIEDISKSLNEHNIPFRIFGRSKHLYSIYKKMETKHKRFEEILDLLAIRIVTQTELNCYEILGYIHASYRPIPGRLKDYIAMPKTNMYQSLHTTVVGIEGCIFEVQIRTEEMDSIAEKGIAAHWSYKEGKTTNHTKEQSEIVKELEWLKAFEESSIDANTYMNTVIEDVFHANIYCMTPKGRIIDLPNGSTPIDFAYRIHTEVGHQTVGATVNSTLVPLNTKLKTGDVVELKTNKNSGPSEDWLKIVKTNNARNKIRAYLTKKETEQRQEMIKQGEVMLKEDMKRRDIDPEEYFDTKKFESIYGQFQIANYNEFMYAIACKSLSTQAVIEKLVKVSKKGLNKDTLNQILEKNKTHRKASTSKTGIVVDGVDSMKISMAACCNPIYNDEIVGYVTKGQGIKVHRKDCPNIKNEKSRLISVSWDEERDPNIKYETDIRIFCKDRNFLLTDLITVIAQYKARLLDVNVTVNKEDFTATANMTLVVEDTEHLQTIISNLKKINSVLLVERVIK